MMLESTTIQLLAESVLVPAVDLASKYGLKSSVQAEIEEDIYAADIPEPSKSEPVKSEKTASKPQEKRSLVGALFGGKRNKKAGKSVKKIFLNPVSKDTLESSASEYVYVVKKNIITIRIVRQSYICPGVFYISENFLKNFWKDPLKRAFPFGRKNEGKFMPSLSASWNGKEVKPNGTISFPG